MPSGSSDLPAAVLTTRVLDTLQRELALRYGWSTDRNPEGPKRVEEMLTALRAAFAPGADEEEPVRFAARLAVTIVERSPYAEGNGALALVLICVVLGRADFDLVADQGEAVAVLTALHARQIKREALTRWIRRHAIHRTTGTR